MNDQQLLRYSRHIVLSEIGYEGQLKLTQSHALVVGVGGLGSAVALYLAASGVGQITLCDFDTVDLNNLQRQIVHHTAAIGLNKAESARATLALLNPEVQVHTVTTRLDEAAMRSYVAQSDVVLDCSDNFATRYSLNRLCLTEKKPLVSGSAIGFSGQMVVFRFQQNAHPCYQCLFPDTAQANDESRCAENGVFSPLVGVIGSLQASEALKVLLDWQEADGNTYMVLFDAKRCVWRRVRLAIDPDCVQLGSDCV